MVRPGPLVFPEPDFADFLLDTLNYFNRETDEFLGLAIVQRPALAAFL